MKKPKFARWLVSYSHALLLSVVTIGAAHSSSELVGDALEEFNFDSSNISSISKEIAKQTEVVGLGEYLHGSYEGHDFRLSLARSLIENHGFRVFMLEAPWYLTLELNKRIQASSTCEWDPNWILWNSFRPWRTRQFEKFYTWVCEFNHRHKKNPVRLIGADIQLLKGTDARPINPENARSLTAIGMLNQFSNRAIQLSPATSPVFPLSQDQVWNTCFDEGGILPASNQYKPTPESSTRIENCESTLDIADRILQSAMKNRGSAIWREFDAKLIELALKSIRWSNAYFKVVIATPDNEPAANAGRDEGMFQVVEYVRTRLYPGKKIILYAHNLHIARNLVKRPYSSPVIGITSLGSKLAVRLKHRYWPLAVISGSTSNQPEYDSARYCAAGIGFLECLLQSELNKPYVYLGPDSHYLKQNIYIADSWNRMTDVTLPYEESLKEYWFKPQTSYQSVFYLKNSTTFEPWNGINRP